MMRRIRLFGVLAAGALGLGLGLGLAAPASAQKMSEGYEFLKAVKDRDGNKVTEALNKPGSVIVNARDVTTGQSALHYVVERRDTTWVRFLVSKGANPNIADRDGVTPLQLAANLGWTDGVEALVGAGASVDVTNVAGETPLIAAVHRRDAALVRVLLKAGANPDRSDNSGRTARDYAELMGAQNPILAELDKARAERKERAAKSYGPGT